MILNELDDNEVSNAEDEQREERMQKRRDRLDKHLKDDSRKNLILAAIPKNPTLAKKRVRDTIDEFFMLNEITIENVKDWLAEDIISDERWSQLENIGAVVPEGDS
tara:strand:- start:3473 stop:3790 length:318 start_codon:yes stop_codon:yes gene_type:complete